MNLNIDKIEPSNNIFCHLPTFSKFMQPALDTLSLGLAGRSAERADR